jgi:hypothetical protein
LRGSIVSRYGLSALIERTETAILAARKATRAPRAA